MQDEPFKGGPLRVTKTTLNLGDFSLPLFPSHPQSDVMQREVFGTTTRPENFPHAGVDPQC